MKKVSTRPRKSPRQERSRAMVDVLLEAAIRVLLEDGYEAMTTAGIAERAGVSVGSLYQYFPNKEALVASIVERHAAAILVVMEGALDRAGSSGVEAGLRAFVRASLDARRVAPALHKILIEQVPRVGRVAEALDTSRKIVALLARYLEGHRAKLAVSDVRLAAIVVETSVEALTHRVVTEHPDLIGTAHLEAEISALVLSYLLAPRSGDRVETASSQGS